METRKTSSRKILQSKIFSHTNPNVVEFEVNKFLSEHDSSKVTYSAVPIEGGQCLFTAFVLFAQEVA